MEDFIDIIILALIAVFILFRLRDMLGEKRGFQKDDKPVPKNDLNSQEVGIIHAPFRKITPKEKPEEISPLRAQLDAIRAADSSFDQKDFLEGAANAYRMILTAFAKGEKDQIRDLMSRDTFKVFSAAMDDRRRKGEVLSLSLERMARVEIENAHLDRKDVTLTVRFVGERVEVLYDKNKEILEGDPDALETVHDLWTFERKITALDPNWILVATSRENQS